MHGPYTAHITIDREEPIMLSEAELAEGATIAHRFYQDATPALVDGALKAAVFTAALLLEPGQHAKVEIHGFEADRPSRCRGPHRAHRTDRGAFVSTLGSRFNERTFRGV